MRMHWHWRALGAALLVAALLLAERADGAPKRRRQKIGRAGEGDEAAVDSNAIDGGGSGRGLSEREAHDINRYRIIPDKKSDCVYRVVRKKFLQV